MRWLDGITDLMDMSLSKGERQEADQVFPNSGANLSCWQKNFKFYTLMTHI